MLKVLLICIVGLIVSTSEGVEHDAERRETISHWHSQPRPTATSFELINTVNQQKITHLFNGIIIDICKLKHVGIHAPTQLNFRAVTTGAASVDFNWNSNFYRRDNHALFSLCGDNSGYPFYGCKDLNYGHQCISAKPWSLYDGKGVSGNTLSVCFNIIGCPAPATPPVRAPLPVPRPIPVRVPVPVPVMSPPSITRFDLINTIKQNTIRTLTNGDTIDICKLSSVGIYQPSQLNFQALTAGHVESVQFSKNSNFFRTDNEAFYSLCGDNSGFPFLQCNDLTFGFQCISARPCTMNNGAGLCGITASICFNIVGCPNPTAAPIAPPTMTPISLPTNAPIAPPTKAPISPPTKAPIKPPTKAPRSPPTKAPIKPPTKAPIRPPTKAPIKPPTKLPVNRPTQTPIRPPTNAPISRPTNTPVMAPIRPPRTAQPVRSPTHFPISHPIVAPIKPPARAPISLPIKTPVCPPAHQPATTPNKSPITLHTKAPVGKYYI